MSIVINTLTVDCHEPRALADFWIATLDWLTISASDEGVMIAPYDEVRPDIFPIYFQRNPDAKRVKNRWHFDLAPDDQDAEVARLEGLGASRVDIGQGEVSWVVMADVEGNEFCVLRSLPKGDPS
jgi:hypothetical protein